MAINSMAVTLTLTLVTSLTVLSLISQPQGLTSKFHGCPKYKSYILKENVVLLKCGFWFQYLQQLYHKKMLKKLLQVPENAL